MVLQERVILKVSDTQSTQEFAKIHRLHKLYLIQELQAINQRIIYAKIYTHVLSIKTYLHLRRSEVLLLKACSMYSRQLEQGFSNLLSIRIK